MATPTTPYTIPRDRKPPHPMTREEYAAWSWEEGRAERLASANDWINSVCAAMGLEKCVPRSQYPADFPPGFYRNRPDPWRIHSIAYADSGYPAINPNFKP